MKKIHLNSDNLNSLINNLNNNNLKFYQFYNTEYSVDQYSFFKYLKKFGKYDKKFYDMKILNKSYYDIETKFDPMKAPDPINTEFPVTSIALYNNLKNKAVVFFLKDKNYHKKLTQEKLKEGIIKIYEEETSKNPHYFIKDLEIDVELHNNEINLIKSFFRKILEFQTLFLIGFNSQIFDDPYTINRLSSLIGEKEAISVISDFMLERKGMYNFEQPDYIRVDLLRLYKPADQGGFGMGKSLPSYKLDYIADVELKINKLDLEGDFNEIYYNDPYKFGAYNLFDIILPYKLDMKLQFLEQIYSSAKYNNSSVRSVSMGRSFMFKYRDDYHFPYEKNTLIRHFKYNKEIFYDVEFN